jgi:transposase
MCNNAIFVYQKYNDFFDFFWNRIYLYPMVGVDETTVQVMKEPGRSDTQKSYMWVFRGGGERPLVQFRYAPTRSSREIDDFIEKYQGCVQTDGYGEYNKLDIIKGVRHAGCWAHARRKFFEAFVASQTIMKRMKAKQLDFGGAFAQKILNLIANLYKVEADFRERNELAKRQQVSADELRLVRQERARPVIELIKKALDENVHHIAPMSLCGKAISYSLNQWSRLIAYLDEGLFGIDNNPVENAIRPFVIGRKNWLFSGSRMRTSRTGKDANRNRQTNHTCTG